MLKLSLKVLLLLFSSFLAQKTLKKLTIDEADSLKIVVLSDLMIDNDGSNYAYTMQMIQNVIDLENQVQNGDDSKVDLVVLMG
jgi:hypothetical protein